MLKEHGIEVCSHSYNNLNRIVSYTVKKTDETAAKDLFNKPSGSTTAPSK